MPTVPTEFVPSVGATAPNMPPVQAGAVEPVRSAAPEQIGQLGAAMSQAGTTAATIGQGIAFKIQTEIDDAKVKGAETQFIQQASDVQNKYLNTSNADALAGFSPTQEAIVKAKQDALSGLDNNIQRSMFNQVASRHLISFGEQISQHQAQQRKSYGISESAARADSMRTMAQNVDVGSKDQTAYIATGVSEVLNAYAAKGFPADSEEARKGVRDYQTELVGDNVNRLMVAGKYDDAKTLLGDQMTAGNVDPDTADRLRGSIESNVKRVETDSKADEIFAAHKDLTIASLGSMLKQTDEIADPEQRDAVRAKVSQQFAQAHSMQQAQYGEDLNAVVNYKASHHDSIRGIDPTLWGKLQPKDQEDLSKPPAIETNVNTMVGFILHPETQTVGAVQAAWGRGQLAKGTYLLLLQEAKNLETAPDKVRAAGVDNDRVEYFANGAGMNVFGTRTQQDKTDLGALTFMVKGDIDAEQKSKGRQLSIEEKDVIIKKNVAKRATLQLRGSWNPAGWFGSPVSPDASSDYAFKTRDSRGQQAPTGDVRQVAIDRLSKLGIENPTDDEINQWYVNALKHVTVPQ